jgi:hypothetical protein
LKTIRIDPLTYDGRFDTEFYGSENYSSIRDKISWYIQQEGFDSMPDTYFLQLYGHYWQIEVKDTK